MNIKAPSFLTVKDILNGCQQYLPNSDEYLNHPIINRFGGPHQPVYIDIGHIHVNDISYDNPLLLPIYNQQLDIIQFAVIENGKNISVIPDGLAKGFAAYNLSNKNQNVMITYTLESFFKAAACGIATVLVVLKNLCLNHLDKNLKSFDFEQIQFVIQKLAKAGFNKLYLPVRPEFIHTSPFQKLEQNTPVHLLNQYQKVGENEFLAELSKDDDIEEVKTFFSKAIELSESPQPWGELLPLGQAETVLNSPYPIHALPPLARDAVIAIAEHVQAPIAMTAQCVIGAMSHIAQAHVNAPHPFNACGEPCSLYLLTEGQSGSRKSTSRNMADKAIIQYERKQYELYRHDLEKWKSGHVGLNKKDRETYSVENPPPNDPSTLYSDITLESIAGLYVDGVLNNASIASDEAGQFFGGYTMKGDMRNQALGGYAKLFDDGFIERTRSKSNLNGSGRAYDVRLTFNLQGQHEVLSDALRDPILRGQGFLPRFILTIPENLAGTRLQDAIYQSKNANIDHRLIAYWTRCEYLLDDCPHPQTGKELFNGRYVIPMDEQAKEIDIAFYNMFEELQGKGKCYEYLQAFASRASQLARRLATVFAYFEGAQWIDAKTLKGACEVVKHSLNEWAMYADIEVKAESDAERLIRWLVRKCMENKTDRILYSNVQTSCPRPMSKNSKILEAVIQQLEDSNYIKIKSIFKKRFVLINPILL